MTSKSEWIRDSGGPNWWHKLIIGALKCGSIPKHIAIIMDGNRRFAKKNSMKTIEGHFKGFEKLTETLEWCLDLGINEVTVYAFSIENFKRTADEVNGLMVLAKEKIQKLLEEREQLENQGVCVRVLGNISLLPEDLQKLIAEVVTTTSTFNRAYLNICLSYTSREEMTTSMRSIVQGVNDGEITISDINNELIEKCLYSSQCQPVDMLLRTSGEVRLSDFLLWQSSYSCLLFQKVLWPDFSRYHLYAAIIHYQKNLDAIQDIQRSHHSHFGKTDFILNEEQELFVNSVHRSRMHQLEKIASL